MHTVYYLLVEYFFFFFFCNTIRSPKLSLCNASGISNEDLSELQKQLQEMAADLVGEVRCTLYMKMLFKFKINANCM